jgi:hypothetical protein
MKTIKKKIHKMHKYKFYGADAPYGPRPIVFKEWRDTRPFSNLKSTHCTFLILLIINLVTKTSLCIVSKRTITPPL